MREDLTDPRVRDELPPFYRPMLYSESESRTPTINSGGISGAGGNDPTLTVIEPPLLGNPSFTVGVSESLAGAQAVLVIDTSDPGEESSIPETGAIAREEIQLSGSGSEGWGSVSIQLPNDPMLVGQTLYGRWYVVDPAASGGLAISPVFTISLFNAGAEAITVTGESRLYNLSVRANLVSGRNLITGFVVRGGEREILLRAAGPAMDAFGLDGLDDPEITMYEGQTAIAHNDNWTNESGDYFSELGAFEFEDGSADAALEIVLAANATYTAVVRGQNNSSGEALVEVYEIE